MKDKDAEYVGDDLLKDLKNEEWEITEDTVNIKCMYLMWIQHGFNERKRRIWLSNVIFELSHAAVSHDPLGEKKREEFEER